MKPSRYKYFSEVDYAEKFLNGQMYCQTLGFFRDYEDAEAQQIVGDEYEGTRIYRPANGLEVTKVGQSESGLIQMGMECLTKADEIYIFCLSFSFTEELKREFRAKACVEIFHPRKLTERWKRALPVGTKYVSRKVGYYLPTDLPGSVWALPDLIATTKPKRFAHQDEYRLAYTTSDAFGFENCKYQLVDRKARPAPKPEEHHHQTLELGSLRDICRLHLF
jgi:hypothetical protein